jgi:lipoic acid synthetase
MSKIQTSSGLKYKNQQGVVAIKDGVKKSLDNLSIPSQPKPKWFKVPIPSGKNYRELLQNIQTHKLNTVCEESKCPNLAECWSHKTATLMVLGNVCTRACKFCAVDTGNPHGWLDPMEPYKTGQSVAFMRLQYVVLTSVDRDDLEDGGANHIANCVKEIKIRNPDVVVEVLSPDFAGSKVSLDVLLASGLDVFSQNIETVDRLTHFVRDPRAGYKQTLDMLEYSSKRNMITKSGMMLGLGETTAEVMATMQDLYSAGVSILTLGQYLRPTKYHIAMKQFVTPEEFHQYEQIGFELGFKEIVAGPLVRSSYRAERSFLSLLNRV